MPFRRKGQTLAVEAAAGRLTGANLTLATTGSPRYLAALTAAPTGEDPSSIAEGAGANLRPAIAWAATNVAAAPVSIASDGDIFIGPFSSPATITHIAIVTTSGAVTAGTVLAWAAITSRVVGSGDRLRWASGGVILSVT